MTLTFQILVVAGAAAAVMLLLLRVWAGARVGAFAVLLSGLVAVGGAAHLGESQIALAWLASLAVAVVLSLTAGQAAATAGGSVTGPFRLLGRLPTRAAVGAGLVEPLRDRVFRGVLFVVLLIAAGVLAQRAVAAGAVTDLALTWAALLLLGGGVVATVLTHETGDRNAAILMMLNGLAAGLILVDRDWGRALAVAILQVIVALNGVVQVEPSTP